MILVCEVSCINWGCYNLLSKLTWLIIFNPHSFLTKNYLCKIWEFCGPTSLISSCHLNFSKAIQSWLKLPMTWFSSRLEMTLPPHLSQDWIQDTKTSSPLLCSLVWKETLGTKTRFYIYSIERFLLSFLTYHIHLFINKKLSWFGYILHLGNSQLKLHIGWYVVSQKLTPFHMEPNGGTWDTSRPPRIALPY